MEWWVGADRFVYFGEHHLVSSWLICMCPGPVKSTTLTFKAVPSIQHMFTVHLSSSSEPCNLQRGHVRTRSWEDLQFITVALLWRVWDWEGPANVTVSSLWPGMEVMSLSRMNHNSYPKGPPGLFLKSCIILLLTGSPAFNIVMILPAQVMYLVWIRPCIHKLFLCLVHTL